MLDYDTRSTEGSTNCENCGVDGADGFTSNLSRFWLCTSCKETVCDMCGLHYKECNCDPMGDHYGRNE